jgi:hypothetical protein
MHSDNSSEKFIFLDCELMEKKKKKKTTLSPLQLFNKLSARRMNCTIELYSENCVRWKYSDGSSEKFIFFFMCCWMMENHFALELINKLSAKRMNCTN